MAVTLQSLANCAVSHSSDAEPVRYAADELRRALEPFRNRAGSATLELKVAPGAGNGFSVSVGAHDVAITGSSPRGCLDGAYWLLEQVGFVWVAPGGHGERVATGRTLAQGEYHQMPVFARRTLILGQDALHDHWPEWLEWASRNRLNDIFFHDTPPSHLHRPGGQRPDEATAIADDARGWMFERWDAEGPAILAAARRRGMTVQFGGHHLPALIDRELFEVHPDWFPVRNGRRDARYNLCISSAGAVEHLRTSARAFFERFAGADVYHLWADDIRGGGWCECDACLSLSPSDQALAATNTVASVLTEVAPGARIAHLAYRDTLDPPTSVRPLPNVNLLWAPRERCYAHSIGDAACERNQFDFWQPFNGLLGTFDNDASRIDAFEYYSDSVLFKWLAPPSLELLPRDTKDYLRAGVGNFQNLMVGPRPWVGPPWHAWWMARCAWGGGIEPTESLATFCSAAYPEAPSQMVKYYIAQDEAFRLILDLHDLHPLPRHDVLDFSDTPRATMVRKARELREAATKLDELRRDIQDSSGWMALEFQQAETNWHVVSHLAHRITAWETSFSDDAKAVGAELALANGHLEWLERWETESNVPAYANLSRPMLRTMRFHTGNIQ